jgi:hypothetical protein
MMNDECESSRRCCAGRGPGHDEACPSNSKKLMGCCWALGEVGELLAVQALLQHLRVGVFERTRQGWTVTQAGSRYLFTLLQA